MHLRSRRGFIGSTAAALAALGLAPASALGSETLGYANSETLGYADFSEMVKSKFYLATNDGSAYGNAKLLKVTDMSIEHGVSQFTLRLRGNRTVRLPEGMYYATNWDGHPNFDVYIMSVGDDRRGRALYDASFALLQ